VAVDVVAVALAAIVAHLLRFGLTPANLPGPDIPYALIALFSIPTWLAVTALAGGYDRRMLSVGSEEYRRVLDGGVHFLAVVAVLHFVFRLVFARGWVGVMIPVAVVLTVSARYFLRRWLYSQRAEGRFLHRILLVGSAPTVVDVGEHLARAGWSGLSVVGVCVDDLAESPASGLEGADAGLGGRAGASSLADDMAEPRRRLSVASLAIAGVAVPVVGTTADVARSIVDCRADAVAITDESVVGELGELALQVELLVAPAITDVAGPRTVVRPVAGLPLLHVEEPTFAGPQRVLKDLFDRASAVVGLALLAPLFLVTAVLIRLGSQGPVFFRQVRVGRDGREFQMVKFRTMVANAADLQVDLSEDDGNGVLFKLHEDPRITKVGRTLRRWSIDELPQLWNVVRGQMSLVGPRPPLPEEVERYERDVNRRLLVKPGMTGLWQVSGRSDLPWDEAVRLDLYYVDHWSPVMDAAIILRTFSAVIRGQGAY
jgi:lipopolysaccharide/colanic/teichoic acid biosynthesis glycosyltransferase